VIVKLTQEQMMAALLTAYTYRFGAIIESFFEEVIEAHADNPPGMVKTFDEAVALFSQNLDLINQVYDRASEEIAKLAQPQKEA
jgi:hypothetical protein